MSRPSCLYFIAPAGSRAYGDYIEVGVETTSGISPGTFTPKNSVFLRIGGASSEKNSYVPVEREIPDA